ncbi:hypothetical protein EV356DRAFT_515718 [Viridothelium virens]|uniref:NTF2-domain-containing protein n=1 Tax=Viridothelium virens TaxID=1048519 RepID=A0A6A6H7P5_VIRVR|nr:hypothetical protein EV356DRAFT_515718 [Viridothelium virens]
MATEQPTVPINGNYAPQQTQAYGAAELSYNPQVTTTSASAATSYGEVPPPTGNTTASGNSNSAGLPSDEVGWYFVERYYTTLSRQPEKLFLFYQKRSQFVSGVEAEKAPVCVGQKAINDRIKELDIQDCKVRVTNVDSQSSDENIVIQVIGEISNKSAPHRKFTQTFVLAKQTNGYFVLNDIFRYIIEDEEFEGTGESEELQQNQAVPSGIQEPKPSTEETEPRTLTSSDDPAAQEADAAQVDRELEQKVLKEDAMELGESDPPVNGAANTEDAGSVQHTEDAPAVAAPAVPEETDPAADTETAPAAPEFEAEKPKAPEPTPIASPPPASTAPPVVTAPPPKPAAPKAWANVAPAAPKTWANLAAAANNRIATPATPAVQPTPSPAANQAKQTPPAPPSTTNAPTGPAAQTTSNEAAAAGSPQDEWQSVNHEHNKRQPRAQPAQSEQPNSRAYIKNVYESVDGDELKKTLEKYGEIAYFDISRQKNCAFVDFATPAGYQAAVAANPHVLGNDRIFVEERRLRPGSYPYVPRGRGDMRGGRGGNGPRDGGRGGFQQKPAFAPRGRGANVGARGRGAAQAA